MCRFKQNKDKSRWPNSSNTRFLEWEISSVGNLTPSIMHWEMSKGSSIWNIVVFKANMIVNMINWNSMLHKCISSSKSFCLSIAVRVKTRSRLRSIKMSLRNSMKIGNLQSLMSFKKFMLKSKISFNNLTRGHKICSKWSLDTLKRNQSIRGSFVICKDAS